MVLATASTLQTSMAGPSLTPKEVFLPGGPEPTKGRFAVSK
jgi:hypothetical protein